MTAPGPLAWSRPLRPGLPIAAGPSRTGTAGAVVLDQKTRAPMLLGAAHVMVDPRTDGTVWQPAPCGERGCSCNAVGRIVRSRRSVVAWRDHWYYVDAAAATIDDDVEWEDPLIGWAEGEVGMRVVKVGAATGATEGTLVERDRVEKVRFGRVEIEVPNQLRVRHMSSGRFAADGDSGAIVADDRGRAVGLLWGADGDGNGVACPIGPVLDQLGLMCTEGKT